MPLREQLAVIITEKIKSGEYGRLPSARQLA